MCDRGISQSYSIILCQYVVVVVVVVVLGLGL